MGGWIWIGGVLGWVILNHLCPPLIEDGPYGLQLFEDCFTKVGWHATFELTYQLAFCCYDRVLGCDVRIGDMLVLVEYHGQYLSGSGVLHPYIIHEH